MPGYKGHLIGGAVVGALGIYLLQNMRPSAVTLIEWGICALLGALFPDIDIKSKGQKVFYRMLLMVFAFLLMSKRYQLFALISILSVVPMIVRHRGLFHKIWFVIGFPLLVFWCISAYFPVYRVILLYDVSFFIAGALSHLWLDLGVRRMLRV